jgi:hypothetical protein
MGRFLVASTKEEKKLYQEKLIKVSLFRENSLAYGLVLMATLFNLAYSIIILDSMKVNFLMGITVFVNISLLFLLFTCAVKMKIYDKKWTFVTLASGIYFALRVVYIVPGILKPYSQLFKIYVYNVLGCLFLLAAFGVSFVRLHRRQHLIDNMKDQADKAKAGR